MNTTAIVWIPQGPQGWFLENLAGLPLLERNLMALHGAGVERVHLCCEPGVLATVKDHLSDRTVDRRMPEVVLHRGCQQPSVQFEGRAVAVDGRRVYRQDLFQEAVSREEEVSFRLDGGEPAGIGVVSSPALARTEPLEGLPVALVPAGAFAQRADSAGARQAAERLIFKSLTKPQDGWFSVHLNRPVSTRISRILARFPVHPNLVTIVSFFAVGVPAAVFSALGSYMGFAVGGILFQLFSVLDGVDGELARVKYQYSRTGQWLDSFGDNLSNILYLAGVTVGVHRALGSDLLLWTGIAAVGLHTLEVAISFWDLATRTHSATKLDFKWEFKQPGSKDKPLSRLLLLLEPLTRQDFYSLLFMVLALAGVVWLVLPFTAIAFCLILLVKVAQLVRRREPA